MGMGIICTLFRLLLACPGFRTLDASNTYQLARRCARHRHMLAVRFFGHYRWRDFASLMPQRRQRTTIYFKIARDTFSDFKSVGALSIQLLMLGDGRRAISRMRHDDARHLYMPPAWLIKRAAMP